MRIQTWIAISLPLIALALGIMAVTHNAAIMPIAPTPSQMLTDTKNDLEMALRENGRIVYSENSSKPGFMMAVRKLDASSVSPEKRANFTRNLHNLHWRNDGFGHLCKRGVMLTVSRSVSTQDARSTLDILAEYSIRSVETCKSAENQRDDYPAPPSCPVRSPIDCPIRLDPEPLHGSAGYTDK